MWLRGYSPSVREAKAGTEGLISLHFYTAQDHLPRNGIVGSASHNNH